MANRLLGKRSWQGPFREERSQSSQAQNYGRPRPRIKDTTVPQTRDRGRERRREGEKEGEKVREKEGKKEGEKEGGREGGRAPNMAPIPMNAADATMNAQFEALSPPRSSPGPKYPSAPRTKNSAAFRIHSRATKQYTALNNGTRKASRGGPAGRETNSYIYSRRRRRPLSWNCRAGDRYGSLGGRSRSVGRSVTRFGL